jgi:hypothetical protein
MIMHLPTLLYETIVVIHIEGVEMRVAMAVVRMMEMRTRKKGI